MSLMIQMKTKSEVKCLVLESAFMVRNLKNIKYDTGFTEYSIY